MASSFCDVIMLQLLLTPCVLSNCQGNRCVMRNSCCDFRAVQANQLECSQSSCVCSHVREPFSTFLTLRPLNTVPRVGTPSRNLFLCYFIAIVCYCYVTVNLRIS